MYKVYLVREQSGCFGLLSELLGGGMFGLELYAPGADLVIGYLNEAVDYEDDFKGEVWADGGIFIEENEFNLSEYHRGLHTKFFVLQEGYIPEKEFDEFVKQVRAALENRHRTHEKDLAANKAMEIIRQLKSNF